MLPLTHQHTYTHQSVWNYLGVSVTSSHSAPFLPFFHIQVSSLHRSLTPPNFPFGTLSFPFLPLVCRYSNALQKKYCLADKKKNTKKNREKYCPQKRFFTHSCTHTHMKTQINTRILPTLFFVHQSRPLSFSCPAVVLLFNLAFLPSLHLSLFFLPRKRPPQVLQHSISPVSLRCTTHR